MSENLITFGNVSRFYGEVLGINKVSSGNSSRNHEPGGAQWRRQDHADEPDDRSDSSHRRAKFACSALRPNDPQKLCRLVGYCAQFDAFPKGLTGCQFISSYLRLFGYPEAETGERTNTAH